MMPWRKSEARKQVEPRAAKRVLVIKLGGPAEFIQGLAAAKAIREAHVGARITLLTNEAMRPLAEKCPYFDVVETDGQLREMTPAQETAAGGPQTQATMDPPKLVQIAARVRAAKYDMIYDLEGSSRTNSLFQGLRPWPPNWSGPASGASHHFVDPDRGRSHPLDRFGTQLAVAGIGHGGPLLPDLSWIRSALRDPPRLSPDYFGVRGRYVLMFPRGSDAAPARRWPMEKYSELARRCADHGVTPVVMGGPEEREIGAAIARGEPRTKNLVTRPDLFQVGALAERAAFALGDDVDLLHVAAAAGAPCLVMLSSRLDQERNAPRGKGGVIALTAAIVADLPVEQVERQMMNCGVYRHAATA